jgi:hypothetical protein
VGYYGAMPWTGPVLDDFLVPSAARTTAGNLESGEGWSEVNRLRAQLDVTAASGTTPNLTVFVETTLDGTNWDAVGTFAAKTAAGREVITINPLIGTRVRVRWAITGTTPSFTFSVRIQAEAD